ncbi:uncharacterized protein F4807DRAFT_369695 [Annulohypoxylon truncatum]|uniref:uncharacterized protein n=1 Tax=Annulohypoxylon truncatum TaxID=327061 RepID=UPI0020083876|nr:uncharacterized protein F4807DRAFT_369695 [Annulohypoxylon truncatum]KAI1212391.1 hypothetical protein F4807DRAFT_369695 [Annulohypoxylon truncatum]
MYGSLTMTDTNGHPHPTSMRSTCQTDGQLTRELSLYNGVSNRSRGWKTKRSDKSTEIRPSRKWSIRRWDGASMSSNAWDHLKRDPELWYRDGNCYIHLYGQGQSRRGPAFKVPFSGLLEAKCEPFIDRFMAQDIIKSNGLTHNDNSDPVRRSRIELFIPSPPRSEKQMSYKYHLATRNFIAYVFRRSVVGENLGAALVTLMHSMFEFRTEGVDNVKDLMDYLDEEGYLNFRNNPTHSLAILHLAETFQLRNLYISAFAHCCGMSGQLPSSPEYQFVSPGTRKLIRCARVEMNLRLGQSANMVGTFLEYELSEAHLGLYAGARAHLERFRTLLQNFYVAKFGSYPPPSVDSRTTMFEIEILQEMRADFEALYQYLVDETIDITNRSPFLAEGGICAWQCIQAFDRRHEFKTLLHPLPLLPKVSRENTKRTSWLGKPMKSDRKWRENTHAALLEATNSNANLMKNGLVRIYRQFEEGLAYWPTKADKIENLGPMDSRKVRWILIYATYQALRQATEIPSEVRDTAGAPYHLCISTADLPPWDEDRPVHKLVRRQTHHLAHGALTSPSQESTARQPSPREQSFEIKPDIDYFALTHRDSGNESETKDGGGVSRLRRAGSWTGSLTSNLSRNLTTTRRPSAKLTKQQPDRTPTPIHRNSSSKSKNNAHTPYHEIVVQGYGNGTNDIKASLVDVPPPPKPKRKSTIAEEPMDPVVASAASTSSSRYSSNSDLRKSSQESSSTGSAGKTPDTSVCGSATTETQGQGPARGPARLRKERRAADSRTGTCTGLGFRRRMRDERARTHTFQAGCGLGLMRRRERERSEDERLQTHCHSHSHPDMHSHPHSQPNSNTHLDPSTNQPVDSSPAIQEISSAATSLEMPAPQAPTSWDYVKAVMEVKATSWMTASGGEGEGAVADDVHPGWEMYNDLGGLTEVHENASSAPSRAEGRRLVKAPPPGRGYF